MFFNMGDGTGSADTAGKGQKGRPQRPLSLRQREEIQEVLWTVKTVPGFRFQVPGKNYCL
jgi:hypothetical protein